MNADNGPSRSAAPASLGGILRRGAAISALTLIIMQGLSFVSTVVVARFLSPAEIGTYAAGTVLSGFLVMFAHSGLQGALIQRDHEIDDAAETVFWATGATGLGMSLLALAASPVIAMVFRNEQAGQIAAITSGMLLLHALTNVPDGLMQRRFNFKRRMIVDPSRAFAYAAVAVVLAASGVGVNSVVIANYVSLAVWLVGTWSLAGWRPGRGRASVRLWRELARFAFPLVIQGVAEQAREGLEAVVVGRALGTAPLGQYRYGKRLAMLPVLAVVEVGSYVLFPGFSRLASDPQRLAAAFLQALRWIWFASAPLAALTIALGEPAVVVLLGGQWRAAGVFLVTTAGYGLGAAVEAVCNEGIKAGGCPRLLNWASATQVVLGIALILGLLRFGLVGVGLAISATQLVVAALLLGLARRVIPVSPRALLGPLVRPTVAAGLALCGVWPLEHLLLRSDRHGTIIGLALLVLDAVAFATVYLAATRLVDKPTYIDLVRVLRRVARRSPATPA